MENEKGYHKLLLWKKSREFIGLLYKITDDFPKSEQFGLTSQVRRAALSVLLNIVEGQRKQSIKEFLHYLDIADGSLAEVEACLEIAVDLGFLHQEKYHEIEEKRREIAKMLVGLIKTVKKSL